MANHPIPLETVSVTVPEEALEAFEAALGSACETVGFFRDHDTGTWRVEGVKPVGVKEAELASALALASALTGVQPALERTATEAEGWLARTYASFPEQLIGKRFAVRGTHLKQSEAPGRIGLVLDAGLAFGSGEHGSTRGCLVALETVARRWPRKTLAQAQPSRGAERTQRSSGLPRTQPSSGLARTRPSVTPAQPRPRRILDMGTGSGILAMAAARLLKRPVLATDIEPWAVRVARENAAMNGVGHLVDVRLADGWQDPYVRSHGPYDLVFANILARPLCLMARRLAANLAPGGTAILAGLLATQARWVLAAHRRQGLRLERMVPQGKWTTIVVRQAG